MDKVYVGECDLCGEDAEAGRVVVKKGYGDEEEAEVWCLECLAYELHIRLKEVLKRR